MVITNKFWWGERLFANIRKKLYPVETSEGTIKSVRPIPVISHMKSSSHNITQWIFNVMQFILKCSILTCAWMQSVKKIMWPASTTNGRFFSFSCFVKVLNINTLVLKVKACRNSCHGFPLPLVGWHWLKGCEKGTGNSALRVECLLPALRMS